MINNNTDFILNNKKYNISSLSLLQNFKKKNLNIKPYPYLSIKNALPEEIYEHLSNNYPSDEIIIIESMKYKLESNLLKLKDNDKNKDEIKKLKEKIKELDNKNYNYGSNLRYDLPSIKKKKFKFLDSIWKLFIDYHNSELFINEVKNIFSEHLMNLENIKYKLKKKNTNDFKKLSFGVREKFGNYNKFDIITDCQIGINTPCESESFVRGPHIDNLNEVYAGLFYLKHKDDKTEGGDLEIYDLKEKYKNLNEFQKKIKFLKNETIFLDGRNYRRKNEFDSKYLNIVDKVKYEKNTFVLFLNQINAIHGVSKRQKGNKSRRLVNVIGESYFENGDEKKYKIPIWSNKN